MKTKKPRYAAKILALVLSMLMLLGAMPVAFATDGDIVTKWPVAERQIEFGQKYVEAGLIDGEATIPGVFEYSSASTPNTTGVGVFTRKVNFVPEDTSVAPIEGTVDVTVLQSKSVELVGGIPTASAIQAGQKLSDSVINTTGLKLMNYGKPIMPWKCTFKEANKVMDKAGTYTETVVCAPIIPPDLQKYAPVELDIEIVVEGNAEDLVEVAEYPTASDLTIGQTLADSVLTGGLVKKGGQPVAGKFEWKDPNFAPPINMNGTAAYTVVFTPDDLSVCEPIEMEIPLTTNKVVMEITWPTLRGHYKVGGVVRNCVTFEGGSSTVPGKFDFDGNHYLDKIPEKMGESMEVYIRFIPDNKKLYETQYKSFMVTFEPADPDCRAEHFISSDSKNFEIRGRIANDENWSIHTGNFYLYLDGEKIELTEPDRKFKYDISTLSAGEHTIYSEYIPGENDVYAHDTSDTVTFTVKAFYAVNVTDSTGTKTLDSYLPGKTVTVTAEPHAKSYYDFTGWTAEGITLTEEEAAQQKISFTMPENEVNLTANYKFNFKNFVKYVFEQIGARLMALVMQGIEWIKGLLP